MTKKEGLEIVEKLLCDNFEIYNFDAENELYIIRDTRYNSIYFIYAKNPKEALKNFLKEIDSWRAENDKQQKIRK